MKPTPLQITSRNDKNAESEQVLTGTALRTSTFSDTLTAWKELYLNHEVTTAASSRQVQARDIHAFINFVIAENGNDDRQHWTPRLSRAFLDFLKTQIDQKTGQRRYQDRTINRILTHNKTFAKFIQGLRAFPLGDPVKKLKLIPVSSGLETERALTKTERRRLLDAADLLIKTQGKSKDRNRYKIDDRPQRKRFRAYRNRAIIYTLVETGMRRAAIKNLDFESIDFFHKQLKVQEKGGFTHSYQISSQGLQAIGDYLEHERGQDEEFFNTNALFLASGGTPTGDGRLSVRLINLIWNEVASLAGVEGKTPHSARHAVGKHIIEKTGNIAAVQKQLGHKNAVYSMQYARISREELKSVLDDRE